MLTPKTAWLVKKLVAFDCDCGFLTTNLGVFDSKEGAIAWVEANAHNDGCRFLGSWHPNGLEYRRDRWVSWCLEEMEFNPELNLSEV